MASINNTYDMNDDIDDLEEKSKVASYENFAAARDYMLDLLRRHGFSTALMGGYSLYLRGSPRRTIDIDIAVRATMLNLESAIHREQRQVHLHEASAIIFDSSTRLLWPRGLKADVVRTFVKTGLPHDNSGSREQLVQVDLKLEGL
jgi:hypothetical protein